ncbi:unnamed protein product, partial [Allacma fusca]
KVPQKLEDLLFHFYRMEMEVNGQKCFLRGSEANSWDLGLHIYIHNIPLSSSN